MKKAGDPHCAGIASSDELASSPGLDLSPGRKIDRKHGRRRGGNPSPVRAGVRLRKDGRSVARKNSPATPLLKWKFQDVDPAVDAGMSSESGVRATRKAKNGEDASLSARRLAAGLWHLQFAEAAAPERPNRMRDQLRREPVSSHVRNPSLHSLKDADCDALAKLQLQSPLSVSNHKNGSMYKLEPTFTLSNAAMEQATKWDSVGLKTSGNIYGFYGHLKRLEDQQFSPMLVVSAFQAELEQARKHIHELELEKQTAKKKFNHFLKKLSEEKATWQSREHEKIRAVIEDIKDDLKRERKNRQRMEILNSKLVNELADAKLSAKRLLQDYEKERKAREVMEEVCDELAKEIGEDKAEVEAMKRESTKFREEVAEERKMLQMAEVWREERVQMKLVDAKLTLEQKYSQLTKLVTDLEDFLRSRSSATDVKEIREAEYLKGVASSMDIQDIKEFTYQPTSAEDIFSVLEDLESGDPNNREINPASQAMEIHAFNPEINGHNQNHVLGYLNGHMTEKGDSKEDGSDWETVTQHEEQGSSNSPEGSYPSVNGHCDESALSGSGAEWGENLENEMLNAEISEVYSASVKQPRKKSLLISRLWKSGAPSGDNCKTIPAEVSDGRVSNGRLSNGTVSSALLSPGLRSAESGRSPLSLGQWSSTNSANPHSTRGVKGCIQRPMDAQKTSLKAKLMEARLGSQKFQLRHVLKHKI